MVSWLPQSLQILLNVSIFFSVPIYSSLSRGILLLLSVTSFSLFYSSVFINNPFSLFFIFSYIYCSYCIISIIFLASSRLLSSHCSSFLCFSILLATFLVASQPFSFSSLMFQAIALYPKTLSTPPFQTLIIRYNLFPTILLHVVKSE